MIDDATLDNWYEWGDHMIEHADSSTDASAVACACARMRLVISELKELRAEINKFGVWEFEDEDN